MINPKEGESWAIRATAKENPRFFLYYPNPDGTWYAVYGNDEWSGKYYWYGEKLFPSQVIEECKNLQSNKYTFEFCDYASNDGE